MYLNYFFSRKKQACAEHTTSVLNVNETLFGESEDLNSGIHFGDYNIFSEFIVYNNCVENIYIN